MSKRTRRGADGKSLGVTARDNVYVGLDVHKATIHAAVRVNGCVIDTWVMPANAESVIKTLEPFQAALNQVVYEAGPTGFGLARGLRRRGFPIDVIAPGKTPRPATPGSKSDRLDCRRLAEFAEKGLLKVVAIPTETEDQDRQVLRLRAQVVKKLRRVKQQIKSLLLYNAIAEPEGLKNWTLASVGALREMELPAGIHLFLEELLDELDHLRNKLRRVERAIALLARQERYRDLEAHLRTHPGVGQTTAMTFLTEVYQPGRFVEPEELSCYVGLAPRVSQSGERRREGPLIKAGRGTLRALLVEAGWRWVGKDEVARAIYRRLTRNTGNSQKAIVGVARRMAVNLWCMAVRGEDYRPDYRRAGQGSRRSVSLVG